MRSGLRLFLLLSFPLLVMSGMPAQMAPGASGIQMTVQFTNGDRKSEQVIYLQNDHRRSEYRNEYYGETRADGTTDVRYGPPIAAITRCDLGQRFELNLEDRQFEAWPNPQMPWFKEMEGRRHRNAQIGPPDPPVLRVETTTFDTGERKNFFGHMARHVITTRKETPLAESHFQPMELVTDAWYIDLETRISCEPWATSGIGLQAIRMPGRISDKRYEVIEKGVPETGFAVESEHTWHSVVTEADGTKKQISFGDEIKITQFAEGALDPALFEVPSNFRKVQTIDRNPPMTLTEAWNSTRIWFRNMTDRVIH